MGKGKRGREQRATLTKEPVEKSFWQKVSDFFKIKVVRIVATVLVVAILVAAFGSLAIGEIRKSTGVHLRSTVSVTSENYEINNATLNYMFRSTYNQFYYTYYSYLSYFGLDPNVNLKKQTYGDGTWFDYFMDQTIATVERYLVLAEGALANGMTLTDEDKAAIDETVADIKKDAIENGYGSLNNYFAAMYGNGIKEKDVRVAMELETLALNYQDKLYDSYEFDKDDYTKYCEDNLDKFYTAQYVYYTVEDEASAKKLSEATTYEEFITLVEEYAIAAAKADTTKDQAEEVDEEEIKKAVAEDLSENTKTVTFANEKTLDQWVFNVAREVNDTFVDNLTVYMLLKTSSRDEAMTRNVRHILVDTEEKANALLDEWKKDPTVENFTKLVEENSADTGSITTGGLYENVYAGAMITEFNDWLFDEERVENDSAVVKTDYGYHVMWYVGLSDLATWEVKADEYLISEAYDADYKKLEEAHPVTVDNAKLSEIPG